MVAVNGVVWWNPKDLAIPVIVTSDGILIDETEQRHHVVAVHSLLIEADAVLGHATIKA